MPGVVASGTQTATLNTEHTLNTDTSNKTYVLGVDLNALVNGETVELRVYTKMLSGSTSRLAYIATYVNVQGIPNVFSPPITANNECKVTLKQIGGTGRAFDWVLLSL